MKKLMNYFAFFLFFGFIGESFAGDGIQRPQIGWPWCGPQNQYCVIEVGNDMVEVERGILPQLYWYDTTAPDDHCYLELCYEEDTWETPTGLNPEYPFN